MGKTAGRLRTLLRPSPLRTWSQVLATVWSVVRGHVLLSLDGPRHLVGPRTGRPEHFSIAIVLGSIEIPRTYTAEEQILVVPEDAAVERIVPCGVCALDLLVRGLVGHDEIVVVQAEAYCKPHNRSRVEDQRHSQRHLAHRLDQPVPKAGAMLLLQVACDNAELRDGSGQREGVQGSGEADKQVEQPEVPLAHAVPDPRAVVVKSLDAVLADRAMCATRWAIDVAGRTMLHLEGMHA
mmetsp:Transcript_52853/g.136467  ORF Transcript_52853/g.136467 Transcript_52853/m.136467 type:complete len:237 (+) Transcript_52853:353-1063(+)